jgi:hypothetical protein
LIITIEYVNFARISSSKYLKRKNPYTWSRFDDKSDTTHNTYLKSMITLDV